MYSRALSVSPKVSHFLFGHFALQGNNDDDNVSARTYLNDKDSKWRQRTSGQADKQGMASVGQTSFRCPVAVSPEAKASCESIDKLNDYGDDGTVLTGHNAAMADLDASDPSVKNVRARNTRAEIETRPLAKSAAVVIDTSAWVNAPGNVSTPFNLTRPDTWPPERSPDEVLRALEKAKRNAAEFARNLYVANDGQLSDGLGGRFEIRIVPTAAAETNRRPSLISLLAEGRIWPWVEQDNLEKTAHGVDVRIDAQTLEVPSVEELTAQWERGLQLNDDVSRMAWAMLKPNGPLRNGLKQVASSLATDLRGVEASFDQEPPARIKNKVLALVHNSTRPRALGTGADAQSVEKIINSMSRTELKAFVASWAKRVAEPAAQDDALAAAVQFTRNVTIKARAEAKGKYAVAVANGHDIDVVARVAAEESNATRFAHVIEAPVQTVNIDVMAKAGSDKSEVGVAVSTPDAIRVVAQVSGVLNDNKVLGTGTFHEALTEFVNQRGRK